jgi:hypothetical protein
MGHLIRQAKQTDPRAQIFASPDAESGLRAISPHRPTLSSASGEFFASPELGLSHLLHRESHGRPLRLPLSEFGSLPSAFYRAFGK